MPESWLVRGDKILRDLLDERIAIASPLGEAPELQRWAPAPKQVELIRSDALETLAAGNGGGKSHALRLLAVERARRGERVLAVFPDRGSLAAWMEGASGFAAMALACRGDGRQRCQFPSGGVVVHHVAGERPPWIPRSIGVLVADDVHRLARAEFEEHAGRSAQAFAASGAPVPEWVLDRWRGEDRRVLEFSDADLPELEPSGPRISDGLPLKVIDQGRRWAEEDDPEKCLWELYGYRMPYDSRRHLYALHEGSQVLGIGCHDASKTWLSTAYAQGVRFYAQGCLATPDGRDVRGCLIALVANKLDQILSTSYRALRRHGARAAARGYEIPGYKTSSNASVLWYQDRELWYVKAETYQRPAKASKLRHVASAAGLKHPYQIVALVEEADRTEPEMWTTLGGWSKLTLTSAVLNPYDMHAGSGSAHSFSESELWSSVYFSYLRHPSVLQRRELIDGAISHVKLERLMRDPIQVTRLGPATEVEPEAEQHDFIYALPEEETDDLGSIDCAGDLKPDGDGWRCSECREDHGCRGSTVVHGERVPVVRADGVLGHPSADPVVFRPSPEFIAGRLGEWPPDSPRLVFSRWAWRAAVELGRRLEEPAWIPEVVGGDMAEGGPDSIAFSPRWGRSARELWARYQAELAAGASFEKAVDLALRCDSCGGSGVFEDDDGEGVKCDCWGGKLYCKLGEPVLIPKARDVRHVDGLARRVVDIFGVTTYHLDASGGGYELAPALEKLGCTVLLVPFGGAPPELLPQQKPYLNQRAAMFGQLADGMLVGLVAAPEDSRVKAVCGVLEWEEEERAGEPEQVAGAPKKKTSGTRASRVKLQDKTELRAKIPGVPIDPADSSALTEAHPRREKPHAFVAGDVAVT